MTMMVYEKDGIVVNPVDPEGLGRVQVFIYGLHDVTGNKIPFEYLPWAYSAQSVVSPPLLNSPVKVKSRVPVGTNPLYAFMDEENLEWHSPSPYIKITENRDPRNYIIFDNQNQQWLNETQVDYTSINNKISELEEQKQTKQRNLEEVQNQLNLISSEKGSLERLDNLKQEQQELQSQYNELIEQRSQIDDNYEINKRNAEDRLVSDRKNATISYPNRNTDQQNMTEQEYFDFISEPSRKRIQELELEYRRNVNNNSDEFRLVSELISINQNERAVFENVSEAEKTLRSEINTLSADIVKIDNELRDLKSKVSSSPKSLTSFEEVKRLDARVGRFDEKTNKVYNTDGEIIGNWNGKTFFLPGYALQPGIPIPKRTLNRLIKPESYLTYNSTNGSKTDQPSTIIIPSDSEAIENSDNNKTHSCDLSTEVRLKILTKRKEVMMAVKWLRDKISAIFSLESQSAIGQWIKATIKQLTAILKSIQKFLKFVNDVILEIARLISQIRQLINWILSLPARILALLQECLSHFLGSISEAFSEAIPVDGLEFGGSTFVEVVELVNQAQSTVQTATETIQSTAIIYTEIKAVEETFEKV